MTQIAKVAVAAATYAIDKPYDYLVPSGMELSVGCRVTVPFGRGNRTAEGMVLQLRQEVPAKPLKAIRSLLDQESVLSEKEIRLALWMRQRYFCTFYDALHTILPAAVWYRYREIWSLCPTAEEEGLTEREQAVCRMLSDGPQERETLCTALGEDIPPVLYQMKKKGLVSVETETSRKVKDHMVELASLAAPAQEVLERLERRRRSAPRQYEAAAFLAKCGETTVHDLCYFTGATRQTLRSLEKQGLIALRSREEYRISPREYGVPAEEITLNQQQQEAYDSILRQTETGRAGVTLLQGVTGSGKTLVYIRLAQTLLEQGKSVMILVPEIALTPQMMARFTAYFGRKVALLHSGLRSGGISISASAGARLRWCWGPARRCSPRWNGWASLYWTRSRRAPTNRKKPRATTHGILPNTAAYRREPVWCWAPPPPRWRRPITPARGITASAA